jgi:hypothetical protein
MNARPRALLVPLSLLLALFTTGSQAQEPAPADSDPVFLGYGTEPGMDYGGRTVASAQSLIARAISSIGAVGERRPALTPAWEIPLAAAFILVQHEVDGHGGRGREFGLSPSYEFSVDFSGATDLDRAPRTNEQGSLLAAGGAEADGVMAHRMLLDAMRREGIDGAKVPLALIAKLDLTLYVLQTTRPSRANSLDFVKQYREGNDMAFYLVSRQATRRAIDPERVWEGTYNPDFDERTLGKNFDAMRAAMVWNLLDPALAGAVYNYFHDHIRGGAPRVHTWMWRPTEGLGLTVGTRAYLAPQEVTRFLDLHAAGRWGVATVYARDLDSSIDRTYGYGASLHDLPLGRHARLGVSADSWKDPAALEQLRREDGWNATAEVQLRFDPWGIAIQGGSKSEGFFPGLPLAKGSYVGAGVTYALDFRREPRPTP